MFGSRLRTFRWVWTALVVAVTSAPYVVNWFSTPAGHQYTWILPPYPEDSFGYIAWTEQAARGALLLKIKYTAIPHSGFLFHPLFLICGWLSALLHCNPAIVLWIAKGVGAVMLLAIFYRFTDYLQLSAAGSVTASLLLGVSSGVGGILRWAGIVSPWARQSTDLWMPEVSTFWALLWNPLFPFSLSLMLLSIWRLDRATAEHRRSDAWWSGGATGMLALLHPYGVPLLFAWATITSVLRLGRGCVPYLARYFAAALPLAVYMASVSRLQPVVARHSLSGVMNSPAVIDYVLGFGVPLLLLVLGLAVLNLQVIRRAWPVLLWFGLSFAFAYLPIWYQRKFIFGAHIPLCIACGFIWDGLTQKWFAAKQQRLVQTVGAIVVLPITAMTSVAVLFQQHAQVKQNLLGAYYLPDETMAGLRYLREHATPDDVVIATIDTSRFIPAFAGNTVIWGHWAMSVDSRERQAEVQQIFDGGSGLDDETRVRNFWRDGAQFVFVEQGLKSSMDRYPFIWSLILRDAPKVFEEGPVSIYHRESY